MPNPIQRENQKPGDASWVIKDLATGHEIEGYASAVSINRGETISFYVNTEDPTYTLDIYRMGWYGGAGARRMLPTVLALGVKQPLPTPDPQTGLIECHWSNPSTIRIPNDPSDPTNWASGVYLVKLTGSRSGKQNYIHFVVRDDWRSSSFLLQDTAATFQAYNDWGGLSLYTAPRAYKVSFNRPYSALELVPASFFSWEYDMVRFLERYGYDVSYGSDLDTHLRGGLLTLHQALLVVGHDEYWSWQMRDNVEAARNAGVSLGFFSANDAYWQVRFEPDTITGQPNRTMVCYKEASLDPYYKDGHADHQHLVTVKFRDSPVSRPENTLIGEMYESVTHGSFDMVISDASNWMFAKTGLVNGSHLKGLLGAEADRVYPGGPANTKVVAHSPYVVNGVIHYSDMSTYTTTRGGTVVAIGSFQWSWGLDDYNPQNLHLTNPAVQQITRNILARFTTSGLGNRKKSERQPQP